MEFLTKLLRSQLSLVNKLSDSCCIKNSRTVQDKLGSIMAHEYLTDVTYHAIDSAEFQGEYIIPNNRENDGVILYLHGGGYCSGDMIYTFHYFRDSMQRGSALFLRLRSILTYAVRRIDLLRKIHFLPRLTTQRQHIVDF